MFRNSKINYFKLVDDIVLIISNIYFYVVDFSYKGTAFIVV